LKKNKNDMHRARDSRGRFLARAKSSIFTTPSTSRNRQETPPSSPTHTPSSRIPGIQEAVVDSPTPSIESELKEILSFLLQGDRL
jgi:hypothetical protein